MKAWTSIEWVAKSLLSLGKQNIEKSLKMTHIINVTASKIRRSISDEKLSLWDPKSKPSVYINIYFVHSLFFMALAFLTPFLCAWTVSLCSSPVTYLCFHLLSTSFLCLNLVRTTSFILQASYWLWLFRSLEVNQLSLTPLLSMSTSHRILPSRSMNRTKTVLLKFSIVILPFLFSPPCRMLNFSIS